MNIPKSIYKVGYTTKFKFGDKLYLRSEDKTLVKIEAIKIMNGEKGGDFVVHYLCGWFNNGSYHEVWISEQFLRRGRE